MKKLTFGFVISLLSILAIGIISSEAEACLEKPKSLKLSETTFESGAEISYGVNCRVAVTVKTDADVSYVLSQGYGEGKVDKLCLTITKGKDYENRKEYCGEELERATPPFHIWNFKSKTWQKAGRFSPCKTRQHKSVAAHSLPPPVQEA